MQGWDVRPGKLLNLCHPNQTQYEPRLPHHQIDLPCRQRPAMPGHPCGRADLDCQGLAWDVPGFQSRLLALSLVGIRRDGDVLGFILFHPAIVWGSGGLVGNGSFAVHHGKGTEAARASPSKGCFNLNTAQKYYSVKYFISRETLFWRSVHSSF